MKLFSKSLFISWLVFSLFVKSFLIFSFPFLLLAESRPLLLKEKFEREDRALIEQEKQSPDHLLSVNQTSLSHLNSSQTLTNQSFFIAELKKKKETEADFNFECRDCKNQELDSVEKAIQKLLNLKTCNIVSHKIKELKKGAFSDFWAQELIGSDLLREELEKIPAPNIENWIGVFDTKMRDHNIHVKNLISDDGLHAVLPELREEKTPFLDTNSSPHGNLLSHSEYYTGKGYKPFVSLYEISYPGDYLFGFIGRAPRYINNSMEWGRSEDIYEVFKELSSSKISQPIIVTSSGNSFPKRLDDIKSKAAQDFSTIIVGGFSPSGFVTGSSQSGKEVSILAPSEKIITVGKNREYIIASGTSVATPLVTGSLVGFEWLSGYHPTAKEAKILLEKTALPTLHSFEKPRLNGAGLLNAYKLGEVAKRLKEKCKNKSIACFKEEILKDENYRFSKDKNLRRDLARAFPLCVEGEKSLAESSCEEKKEVFKRLRKEILLNPSKRLLKSLSCIYKEGEFLGNAEALEKLAMALGTERELRAKLRASLSKEEDVSDDELRLILGMGGFEDELNLSEWERGHDMASSLGGRALPLFAKGFTSGDLKRLKQLVSSMSRFAGKRALPLLEKGFATGNRKLQEVVLHLAGQIGEKALPWLNKILKDESLDKEIREKIKDQIDSIEEETTLNNQSSLILLSFTDIVI